MNDLKNNKHAILLRQGQERILEQLYRNSPLVEICTSIVHLIESTGDDLMCSILEFNSETETLHRLAAPNLPDFFNNAIEGMKIGPGVGACGAAAFIKKRVITADLHSHPFWKRARNLVKKTDLRSCWSQPILGYEGNVLGTFAIYHKTPQEPTPDEIEIIEAAAHLAAIAIGHKKAEEKRSQVELQLQHSKQMEAVETLAEGIAHDFSNFLSIITDNLNTISASNELKNRYAENIRKIDETVNQAKDLVSQILDFSSQSEPNAAEINLPSMIEETIKELETSIPDTVEVVTRHDTCEIWIKGNAEKIRQAFLHLCRNSIEAMEGHGQIVVAIEEVMSSDFPLLDARSIDNRKYAKVTIRDTGKGIRAKVVNRIFEPFFTMNEVGEKTGMGLSVVHGIVKQNSGVITVRSKHGVGSTFSLFFPVHDIS